MLVEDEGGPVSETCLYHCAPGDPAPCDEAGCRCACHAARARALDDRDQSTLESLARDMAAEARPDVAELVAERFRAPRRRVA